jgi:fructuronate reductase
MVVHEPFCQWVIEDDFAGPRPRWEQVGAQLVRDVADHELMKLRCLNGTHSTLAYLGYLAGYETISDTVADAAFARLCETLWRDEILPTLRQPEGENLTAYAASLLARYRNKAIRHRTWQIAMDGSQKLPQRLLGTIADRLATGVVPHGLCLAVAAWMRYVSGMDETGRPIDVRDPMVAQLRSAHDRADPVGALLALGDIFPETLATDARFADAVRVAYQDLCALGARRTVAEFTG